MSFKIMMRNAQATKSIANFAVLIVIVQLLSVSISGQKLCLSANKKEVPSNNIIFIENFSARKCMKTQGLGYHPDSKVVLTECLHRTKFARDQQFQFITTPMNKTMIQQDVGRGDHYCLVTSNNDMLKNTLCNANNLGQSWTLKPVKSLPGQFLIEQFSSKKCLKPKTRATNSEIQLTSCNAYETEQSWKLFYSNPATNSSSTVVPC